MGTLVGEIGFNNVSGLAYDPETQILYGTARGSGNLITIDTTTGQDTYVGDMLNTGFNGLATCPK